MGRPSNRPERRAQILGAFARVLADHGYAGATITAVAAEAGLSPGLLHHHFESKDELLGALLQKLSSEFKQRIEQQAAPREPIEGYIDAALKLDERADLVAAKCWVGLFAEAIREPALFAQMRRMVDAEISVIQRRSGGTFSERDAGCVLAFIIGALVLGAFAPRKTAGFAASGLRALVGALRREHA